MSRTPEKPNRVRPRRMLALIGAAVFLLCIYGFAEIAEDYPEGRYRQFDESVLRAFRTPENLAVPRGPVWLKEAMRAISALGSGPVLTIGVLGIAGYLGLKGERRSALWVLVAAGGGALLNVGLKALAARPRPEIVPHLTEVTTTSFPSGHSMLSAIVYLSVGAVLAQNSPRKTTAVYAVAFAGLVAFAVGCTRVYLGVHYPSDVFAGWIAGVAWTLLCLAAMQALDQRRLMRAAGPNAR